MRLIALAEPFLHGDIHPYMFSLLGSLRLQPEVGFPKSLFGIRQRNATKRLFGLPPIRPKSNTILKKWPQKKILKKLLLISGYFQPYNQEPTFMPIVFDYI